MPTASQHFVDLALQEALPLVRSAFPFVVSIARKLTVDSTGRDAVLVWVILDDATPAAARTPDRLRPIENQIAEKIEAHGLAFEPYVHYRLKGEHDALTRAAG